MSPTPRPVGATAKVAAALLVVLALALGLPGPASAHAYLERTNPADGAVLDRAPDRLALYFSEHVVLEATRIELVDSAGRVTALSHLELETDEPDDTEVPSVVTAALPELRRDAYRIRWSTLSSDDLHRTSGYFVFGVGTVVTAAGFDEPRPRVSESALRWLVLLGMGCALGSALVERLLGTGASRGGTRTRLRILGRSGAAAAALVSVVLLVDQMTAAGLGPHELVTSTYAGRWGLREVGLLAIFVALGRRPGTRSRSGLLVVGAVLAAVGGALLGHAGAAPGAAYTRVAVTAVHLLAVLTWVGGVIALAVVVSRARPGRADLAARKLLRRFGAPAVTLLGVGVASGVYLASATVVSVDAALATTYGRTLLVKLGLVAAMCLLALLNHRRLHGPHDLDLPVSGVRTEAGVAVLLLAATAVLASAQPATEPGFRPQPQATVGPVGGRAQDLQVGVDVSPGLAGVNVVSMTVFDTRRPAPGQVTGVRIGLGDGSVLAATPLGDGRWSVAGVDLPAGPRRLEVTVTRPGLPEASLDTRWTIGAGGAGRSTLVSVAPLENSLRGLALFLVAVLVSGLLLARRRASSARPRTVPDRAVSRPSPVRGEQTLDDPRPRSEVVH